MGFQVTERRQFVPAAGASGNRIDVGSATTAINFSDYAGMVVWFKSTVTCYVRCGGSGVAAASASTDQYFTAGNDYPLEIPRDTPYLRFLGTGAGYVHWSVLSP